MRLLAFITFFLSTITPLHDLHAAQSAVLRLKAEKMSSPDNIKVGDTVWFEIVVLEPEEQGATWTISTDSNERWLPTGPILIDRYSIGPSSARLNKVQFKAILIAPKQHQIPPIVIRKEASETSLTSNALSIVGKSNLGPPNKDKPLWLLPPIPTGGYNRFLIALVIILIFSLTATLLYALFRLITKDRKKSKTIDLYTQILEEIKLLDRNLQQKPKLGEKEWKEFSFGISAIIKRFCSGFTKTNVLDLTDRELLLDLKQKRVHSQHVSDISTILSSINEVRYGTKHLKKEDAYKIVRSTRELVISVQYENESTLPDIKKSRVAK